LVLNRHVFKDVETRERAELRLPLFFFLTACFDKEDEMGRSCSTNGAKYNAYKVLVGKPEGNRPLRRPRRGWVDNIKIDLREIEWDGMDWIYLAQDRDQWRVRVNTVMNLRVP
jgi:hypothetical protein